MNVTLTRVRIPLAEGASVSAVLAEPSVPAPGPAVVLAHGAGNDMHAEFLSAVHEGLAACGFPCLKFNFPYTEQKRRAPDRAPVLEDCYRRVLAWCRDTPALRGRRLVIGGKSMGGRMASHLAAAGEAIDGLVFLGDPLHPAGRPADLRSAHLPRIRVPMLFFAGTRDALCRLELLEETLAAVRRQGAVADLHVVEGGDHSFAVPKRPGRESAAVIGEIIDRTAEWIGQRLA